MKNNYLIGILISLSLFSYSQNIPVDFETGGFGANWTWTVFENDSNPALEIVANPFPTGLNTSSTVAKFSAKKAGEPHAGCETMHGSDIGTFAITASNSTIRIMVYKTKISDVGIKLVTSSSASTGEIKVANTLINQWEQLTFDFSSHIGGLTYDQIVIFPDFTARPMDDVIYFDNIFGQAAYLGSEEISKSNVSIFPNPTNGKIKVKSSSNIEYLELYNMAGKLLTRIEKTNTIDLSDFDKGIYILRVNQNNTITTHKVVRS